LTPAQTGKLAAALSARFGGADLAVHAPPDLAAVDLPAPRVAPPSAVDGMCSTSTHDRASHTYGQSYRDVVRAYGGGSSVVGGVEAALVDDTYAGVVTIDLTGLDRVLEVDTVSRAARIQGGALGPVLEEQLRPHGYTLRHFPQSFAFSTLGGWLATRSGGHY